MIEHIRDAEDKALDAVSFQCLSGESIGAFLQWLETERNCGVATRNQRMSAVKSFLKYAAGKDKSLMALYLDADAIPKRKTLRCIESNSSANQLWRPSLPSRIKEKRTGRGICFS